MPQQYFISAYATSQVLNRWDEASETACFQALAADPRAIGIELPFLENRVIYPMKWLKKNIPAHWNLNLTPLPAVMQLIASNPKAGLASMEPDRKMAIALVQKTKCYTKSSNRSLGVQ